MGEYGTDGFKFEDPAVRHLDDSDIPAIINLFKLNYGDDYAYRRFYESRYLKRCIYSDHVIYLVIEEDGEIVASGALILDYGDYNDQMGEIGQLMTHPAHKGRGLAKRMINALLDATDDTVEFAFGEARTVHTHSQRVMDKAGFTVAGYMPQPYSFGDRRESMVFYANLYGNARALRTEDPPQVIEPVAPLARHVLTAMRLPAVLSIVNECPPY